MSARPPRRRSRFRPDRIVSGCQTGVDRGALDAAMALGIAHGGWCPKGRKAEDGVIPPEYQLCENESPEYAARTEKNVVDSDATLILCRGEPMGGTALTLALAERHGRPHLVVDFGSASPARVRCWLDEIRPATLNVAGPRESTAPGIEEQTRRWLIDLFRQ